MPHSLEHITELLEESNEVATELIVLSFKDSREQEGSTHQEY